MVVEKMLCCPLFKTGRIVGNHCLRGRNVVGKKFCLNAIGDHLNVNIVEKKL